MLLVAKWKYKGVKRDELTFKKGDTLELVEARGGDGWLIAKSSSGSVGLVPGNYFKEVPKEAPGAVQEEEEESAVNGDTGGEVETEVEAAAEEVVKCPSCGASMTLDSASGHTCSKAQGEADRVLQLENQLSALVDTVETTLRESRAAEGNTLQQLLEEKQAHSLAVVRATELSTLYEDSLVQNASLTAENDALKEELKTIKTKTARMVQLFKQKISSSETDKKLKQENADLLDEVEELRKQVASLKSRPAVSGNSGSSGSTRPPVVVSGPPPPPPPSIYRPPGGSVKKGGSSGDGPSCPKCSSSFADFTAYYAHEPCKGAAAGGSMFDAIRGGVSLKKAAPVVAKKRPANVPQAKAGSQASMAEMVAALARQRAASDKRVDAQLSFARSSLRK